MYERINGTVRRLKNIDGTTTNIAYAQIPINYNFGANFSNPKINNEFVNEHSIKSAYNNGIKMNITCNILKIKTTFAIGKYTEITSDSKYAWEIEGSQRIGYLPNLNDETTYTSIYDTFNNFKNQSLRKNLNTLLYNLAHGETPYANSDYQPSSYTNIFATAYDSDVMLKPNTESVIGYPTMSGMAYPQPYLLLNIGHINSFNFIGYINTAPLNQYIEIDSEASTAPTYGIFCSGDGDPILYVYYCTYKGV